MSTAKLSDRIKKATSANKDIEALTEKFNKGVNISADSSLDTPDQEATPNEAADEDDWEKLADKELDAPTPKQKLKPALNDSSILELYDFDTRLQMHQLVKEFTSIVDPTGTMPFRPKMAGQSLMFTFNNPKNGTLFGVK